ncbi:hypothetical protein PENTCL1PPCAC_2329, partial [Pristionchus entomophagus]
SETFGGSILLESINLLQQESDQVFDDLLDDSFEADESFDSELDPNESRIESLRRYHLAGAASKVEPFSNLDDRVHKNLLQNISFYDPCTTYRVPLLAQYLVPILMAEYDTLIVAPPGKSQIEALLIPIVNKIMFSLVDGRLTDKRPHAVILSSNVHERKKILDVVTLLTRDLPIASIEARSIDKLQTFFDFESEEAKVDILITSPAAFIHFTRRNKNKREGALPLYYPSLISTDKLQYLVVFEMEEVCDSGGEYSRIIVNLRREKEFTLVIQTHTLFTNRKEKKCLNFEHAERRSKLENLLSNDAAVVMIDSTICMTNLVFFSKDERDASKLDLLRGILRHHNHEEEERRKRKPQLEGTGFDTKSGSHKKFEKRVVIVVSSERQALFVHGYLKSKGLFHDQVLDETKQSHFLHLERELENRHGKWSDPMKKIRNGNVMGVITSNIHGVRIAHSVMDKIIFFDVPPNMHSLVLNCSKIVDNRRNFFLLNWTDLVEKREELQSLAQYLKDVDSVIPPILKELETIPISVKSIYT